MSPTTRAIVLLTFQGHFGHGLALVDPMPRKLLHRTNSLPYHVTGRTNNREDFPIALNRVWNIVCFELFSATIRFEIEIHAFVLMPNHFHMLVTVPEHDLGVVMHTIMRNITGQIQKRAGKTGHLFGGPYRWEVVDDPVYFFCALKYVYRNPVEARLCRRVENYPFSTYSGLIGNTALPFPILFPRGGMDHLLPGREPIDWLPWLNQKIRPEAQEIIQSVMKKELNTVSLLLQLTNLTPKRQEDIVARSR